jgi:uncharacterized protein
MRIRMFTLATAMAIFFNLALIGTGKADNLEGKIIAIATHPVASLGYTMGSILANVVTKHSPMRVDVEPTSGPKSWLPRMQRGEIQLGLASDLDVYAALVGDKDFYKEPYSGIRVIKQAHHALRLTILVRNDSSIQSMKDLVGKRVAALTPGQPSLLRTSEAAIYSEGVDLQKIKWTVAGNLTDAGRAIKEGRADAACIPIGNSVVEELEAAWGARFLSADISPEGLKRARKYLPTASGLLVNPGPTGVRKPTGFLAFQYNLVASENLSPDIVNAVLKALDENFNEYKSAHPLMKTWDPRTSISSLIPAPVHPAAVQYYKKNGLWTPDVAARNEELLKLIGKSQ